MLVPQELQVADVLLYGPSDLIGYLIAIKSWTLLSHCEVYYGQGQVIAARPEGVRIYGKRIDKYLKYIRRPVLVSKPFDISGAYKAVQNLLGKPYETWALFSFFDPWMHRHRATRICSSVVTKFLRGGGVEPFNPELNEDDVSPAQLWQTPELLTVWERGKVQIDSPSQAAGT